MNVADLVVTCRLLLSLTAGVAVITKVGGGFSRFAGALTKLGIRSARSAQLLAWFVLLSEGGLAAMLLVPATARIALSLSFALYTVYGGFLLINIARGNRVACSCFGMSEVETISLLAVLRAILLAVVSLISALFYRAPLLTLASVEAMYCAEIAIGAFLLLRLLTMAPLVISFLTDSNKVSSTLSYRVSLPALFPEAYAAVPSWSDPRLRDVVSI